MGSLWNHGVLTANVTTDKKERAAFCICPSTVATPVTSYFDFIAFMSL